MSAVLDASRVHHNLLAVLEESHICNDVDLTVGIQQQAAKALLDRNEAIRAVNDHRRAHAEQAFG
jgi:hypothetical protein